MTGYRGYIGSRPVRGVSFPQRVQNLVVRDYATRHGLELKLALVEHAMPGSYMVLADVLAELPRLDGVIMFSLFLLPEHRDERRAVYDRVLATGARLHTALEGLVLGQADDLARLEDLVEVVLALPAAPLGARFDKAPGAEYVREADPFWRALAADGHVDR